MEKKGVDKKRYDRVAPFYDLSESPMELLIFAGWRAKLLAWLPKRGRLLEVGVGTGKNLPYYSEYHEVIAVDISGNMLKKAKRRTKETSALIHLLQMDVERLGFPDQCFDAVVSTYVFCSVENPLRGLNEIRRVIKGNGIVVFLEHMRSQTELIGKAMDLVNPLVAHTVGPNINRRTVNNIRTAGFDILHEEHLLSSIFRIIVAKPMAVRE